MSCAAPVFLEDERGESPGGGLRCVPPPTLVGGGGGRLVVGVAGPLSVLVVEDDPAMRVICAYNLEADGFRVATAETGREGLEAALAETFDLVLLDVMLPDLGGFEVAAELEDVPVVFCSARTTSEDLELGRVAGAIDYVTKPFDPVELPKRLREDLAEFRRAGAEGVWELRFGPSDGKGQRSNRKGRGNAGNR
jgi:two-component system phosphate regulon response regulator PhoB